MIFVIVIPIIVFFITCVYYFIDGEFGFGVLSGILMWFVSVLLVMLFIMMPFAKLAKVLEVPIVYKDTTTQIVALQDGDAITGRTFFLGSGYVKNELEYTYMYDTEKGFAVNQVPAAHSYIKYSNDNPCVIEHKAARFDGIMWNLITMPSVSTEYYFYLPEGSILQGYNIDLQ